jgi:hypothetical protein
MIMASLDINATRIAGVRGALGQRSQPLYLDGQDTDLPLAIAAGNRQLQFGRAALGNCRRSPQLVYSSLLPTLGQSSRWRHGRHRLDPAKALLAILQRVAGQLNGISGAVLVAPGYLSGEQVRLLHVAAEEAKLPVQAAVNRSLAAGLANHGKQAWHHVGLVVDVDDYALTCAVLRPRDSELCCLGHQTLPMIGLRLWRERLLGRIADLCVRTCRRDPRDNPDADQQLFNQIDQVLDAAARNQPAAVRVAGFQWMQALTVAPSEAAAACAPLARQAAQCVDAALKWAEQQLTSATVYLTTEAARLPGLPAAIHDRCANKAPIVVLPANAAAQAALAIAHRIGRQELPGGNYGVAIPLPVESEDCAEMIPFPTMDLAIAE